jgi:toxin YoeB
MKIIWTASSLADYLYWQKLDKKKLRRINELIKSCQRTPFEGIGNPEPLRHELQGFWSRRIDTAHRLVYQYENDELLIISCRYHYGSQ